MFDLLLWVGVGLTILTLILMNYQQTAKNEDLQEDLLSTNQELTRVRDRLEVEKAISASLRHRVEGEESQAVNPLHFETLVDSQGPLFMFRGYETVEAEYREVDKPTNDIMFYPETYAYPLKEGTTNGDTNRPSGEEDQQAGTTGAVRSGTVPDL